MQIIGGGGGEGDPNAVHKTGNEIINGQKVFCFSENVDTQGTYSNLYKLFYRSLDSSIGDVYADGYDRYLRFDFQDKNKFRLGGLEYAFRSGGNYDIKIGARKIDGSGDLANLRCGYDENEIAYGIAPSTSESRSFGGDIVTRDWIPKDTRIVHRSGDESISGVKTFSTVQSSDFNVTNGSLDFANPPSSNDNEYVDFIDGNSLTYSALQASCSSSQNVLRFRVRSLGDTTTDRSALNQMGLTATATDVYGFCPTPSSTSENSTHIATTAWVRTATGDTALNAATATDLASGSVLSVAKGGTGSSTKNFVDLTTTQEITGAKTFNTNRFNSNLRNFNGEFVITTKPSSPLNRYFAFCDNNSGEYTSGMQERNASDQRSVRLMLRLYNDTTTNTSSCPMVGLYVNDAGTSLWFASGNNGNNTDLGSSTQRWNNTYLVSDPNVSSDARLKNFVASLPDAVLDVWDSINWVQYKLVAACEKKGNENARLHSGLIAQRVDEAFRSAGLDASDYGFFCHDSWDAVSAETGEDGSVVEEGRDAGDEYSIRYTEALCMEAAYERRRASRAEARIATLAEEVSSLKSQISQILNSTR